MNYAFRIALRYVFPKRTLNFISIITIISVVGIAIGVAALIVVLSIFNGFRQVSEDMILQIDPAVRIASKTAPYLSFSDVKSLINELKNDNSVSKMISSVIPVLETKAVLINRDKIEVIQLLSSGD